MLPPRLAPGFSAVSTATMTSEKPLELCGLLRKALGNPKVGVGGLESYVRVMQCQFTCMLVPRQLLTPRSTSQGTPPWPRKGSQQLGLLLPYCWAVPQLFLRGHMEGG